jgi:hypothetical protein
MIVFANGGMSGSLIMHQHVSVTNWTPKRSSLAIIASWRVASIMRSHELASFPISEPNGQYRSLVVPLDVSFSIVTSVPMQLTETSVRHSLRYIILNSGGMLHSVFAQ